MKLQDLKEQAQSTEKYSGITPQGWSGGESDESDNCTAVTGPENLSVFLFKEQEKFRKNLAPICTFENGHTDFSS